jgi:hypothetical protein
MLSCALLAGCGDDSSAPGTGGSSGKSGGSAAGTGSSKGPNCSLMSASEVSATLGVSSLEAPKSTVNDIVTICQYAMGNNALAVSIRYQTPTTDSEFGLGKQGFADNGFSTMDVSGIGEMAYSSSIAGGSISVNTLVLLYKSVEIEIVASADFDKEKALAKAIIAKL